MVTGFHPMNRLSYLRWAAMSEAIIMSVLFACFFSSGTDFFPPFVSLSRTFATYDRTGFCWTCALTWLLTSPLYLHTTVLGKNRKLEEITLYLICNAVSKKLAMIPILIDIS